MAKSTLKQFNTGRRSPSSAPNGSLAGTRGRMTGTNGRWTNAMSKYLQADKSLVTKRETANSMTTNQRSFKGSAGKVSPNASGRGMNVLRSNSSDRAFRTRIKGKSVR